MLERILENSALAGVMSSVEILSPPFKLTGKLKEAYLAVNTNADIEIQTSDSTTGVTSTQEGICDIGMASRDLKDTETGVTAYCVDVLEEKVEKWEEIEDTEKDEVV